MRSELAALGAEKTLCDCSFRKGHSEWAQELRDVLSSLPAGASPAAGSRAGRAHRALSSQSPLSSCNVQSDMILKSHPQRAPFSCLCDSLCPLFKEHSPPSHADSPQLHKAFKILTDFCLHLLVLRAQRPKPCILTSHSFLRTEFPSNSLTHSSLHVVQGKDSQILVG